MKTFSQKKKQHNTTTQQQHNNNNTKMFSQISNYLIPTTTAFNNPVPILNLQWLVKNPEKVFDLKMDKHFDCNVSIEYCKDKIMNEINYLENQPEKFDWSYLSSKNDLLPLMRDNLKYVEWNSFSANPGAIGILPRNLEKINWYLFLLNPHYNTLEVFDREHKNTKKYTDSFTYNFIRFCRFNIKTYRYFGYMFITPEKY